MQLFAQALKENIDDLLGDDDQFMSVLTINPRVVNREIDSSLSEFTVELGPERNMPMESSKLHTTAIFVWGSSYLGIGSTVSLLEMQENGFTRSKRSVCQYNPSE